MERRLIVEVGVVCGSLVMFTAAMCCSRPERQAFIEGCWAASGEDRGPGRSSCRRVLPAGASDDPTLYKVWLYLIITSRMRLGRAIFVSFFALSASYHPGEYI